MRSVRTVLAYAVITFILVPASAGFGDPSIDLKMIESILSKKKTISLERLLTELPESYRSSFTLMFKSRSLQGADPERPRVIMYGEDASLILAFNSGPSQEHGDSLEMIAFNDKAKAFEFYEISFDKGAQISRKNPAKCLTCHTSDPRPNWEQYNFWPGAYGEADDAPSDKRQESSLRSFIAQAAKNPRYRTLVGLKNRYTRGTRDYNGEANNNFTQRVAALNFKRMARMIQATPDYRYYKYAALGALNNCDSPEDFFPPAAPFDRLVGKSLTYRVFDARGISTAAWSMSFDDPGAFQTPGHGLMEGVAQLVRADSDLKPLAFTEEPFSFNGFSAPYSSADCEILAKKSRAMLQCLVVQRPDTTCADSSSSNEPIRLDKSLFIPINQ